MWWNDNIVEKNVLDVGDTHNCNNVVIGKCKIEEKENAKLIRLTKNRQRVHQFAAYARTAVVFALVYTLENPYVAK